MTGGFLPADGAGVGGDVSRRDAGGVGDRFQQTGGGGAAASGDAAHQGQLCAGVDQILVLPNAGPTQGVFVAGGGETAGGRGETADVDALQQAGRLGITFQGLPAHFNGQGGECTVAGVGQRAGEVLTAVNAGAGDLLPVYRQRAAARIGEAGFVVEGLQSGGGGHQLEGRAGGVGGGEKAVEIGAVIFAVSGVHPGDFRFIVRVVGGRGEHTEDITGPVVVQGHGALLPGHGVVGRVVQVGVQGQRDGVAGAGGAGDQAEAHQLIGKDRFCASSDVAVPVSHSVERGNPGGFVCAVGSGGAVVQDGAVPVADGAGGNFALSIDVLICGKGGPLSAVQHVEYAEGHQAGAEKQNEQENK